MRATTICAAALVFFAAANAEARGCSERSSSRAVGLANCHRFGDWDQGEWAPSFETGFVFRAIPLPSNIDLCARAGKSCGMVGTLEGRATTQQMYGGMLGFTAFGFGPARFGAELGIGATDTGTLGTYSGMPVRSDNFVFVSIAATAGLAFGWNRFGFRAEGVAGVSSMTADTSFKTADGRVLVVDYTYPQLEGRVTAMIFITPWVSIGGFGGYGVGDVWHAGAMLRFHLLPFDGTHG